jgi:hypothetical protein
MRRTVNRSNVAIRALPTLFFAGRAVLTFENHEAGTHMTVKVSQARDKRNRKKLLPVFHVNVKLLGDRLQSYAYAGTVFTETGDWNLSRTTRPDSQVARVFSWLKAVTANPELIRGKVNLFHEGRCCKCGLPLTHPESISTAIGPKCLKDMMAGTQGFNPTDLFELAS